MANKLMAAATALVLVTLPTAANVTPALALADTSVDVAQPEQEPGKGDDLARIRRWRSFLDRAHRAFFAAHHSTAQVKAKIEEADQRIEELENAPTDDPGGRSDITGDVAFLERAQRAFVAAHMNTAAVNQWLEEAREGSSSS